MKFRKKPIVIEAFQFTRGCLARPVSWPTWALDAYTKEGGYPPTNSGACGIWGDDQYEGVEWSGWLCGTLEGPHQITFNDWIIRGVRGELYPCKPDIFEATYEKVEEDER